MTSAGVRRASCLSLVWIFLLAAFTSGCASTKVDWSTRIGSYTFDDAVREYGPPDKSAALSDGGVVHEWLIRRGGTGTTVWYPWTGRHGGGPYYYESSTPDYYLRLMFDANQRLSGWKQGYK